MKDYILKHKAFVIVTFIAIIILLVAQFSEKKPETPTTTPSPTPKAGFSTTQTPAGETLPSPISFDLPSYSQPPLDADGRVDRTLPEVITAVATKEKLKKILPIYIKNFKTSNGRITTLNVYTVSSDPDYLVNIEIYGVDYRNNDPSKTNPDAIAFADSFNEVKRQLLQRGVDVHNIYFLFGQRAFIQSTADQWIKTFGLL